MMKPADISRLLGFLPAPCKPMPSTAPPRPVMFALRYRTRDGQLWFVLWQPGQNLDALQAAVDWAMNPELSFNLDDAVWVNEAITMATCGGK